MRVRPVGVAPRLGRCRVAGGRDLDPTITHRRQTPSACRVPPSKGYRFALVLSRASVAVRRSFKCDFSVCLESLMPCTVYVPSSSVCRFGVRSGVVFSAQGKLRALVGCCTGRFSFPAVLLDGDCLRVFFFHFLAGTSEFISAAHNAMSQCTLNCFDKRRIPNIYFSESDRWFKSTENPPQNKIKNQLK